MTEINVEEQISNSSDGYDPHVIASSIMAALENNINYNFTICRGKFAGTSLLWWAMHLSRFNPKPLSTLIEYQNKIMLQQKISKSFSDDRPLINYYCIGNIKLTQKESIILFYILRGYTAKQIATKKHRSVRTIEKHITNIKQKLVIKSKAELIEIASKFNLYKYIPVDVERDALEASTY